MKKTMVIMLAVLFSVRLFAVSEDKMLFDEAENRYKNGDLEFASSRYSELVDKFPLSRFTPDAYFRIAVITLRTGQVEEAEKLFERIETRYPNTRFAEYIPFWKGVVKFRLSEYENASLYFDSFLRKDHSSLISEANLYLAKSEFELGRIESAAAVLDLFFSSGAGGYYDDPYTLVFYLTLLEKQQRFEEIIRISGKISRDRFDRAWMDRINAVAAESFFKTGNIPEAETLYNDLLDADPEISSIGFIRLFSIYRDDTEMQQKVFDKAQIALSGHPGLLNKFLLRVGIDSYNNGHFELASSYLWRIWRTSGVKEVDSLVPVYLARILMKDDDRKGAVDLLSSYQKETGSGTELVLYTLSSVLIEDRNWKEAETSLKKFLTVWPESEYYGTASWMYSFALYNMKKYSESMAVIKSALSEGKSGGSTNDFILLKAKIYSKTGDFPSAIDSYREYLPFDRNNPGIWFELLRLQFESGKYKEAAATFTKFSDSLAFGVPGRFHSLIYYIGGLADIAGGSYRSGLEKLQKITLPVLREQGIESIYPYTAYYRGWANYKIAEYREGLKWFRTVINDYPGSGITSDAFYSAGWSCYILEDYTSSAEYFAGFSRNAVNRTEKAEGLFFYAKSLRADRKLGEAEVIFKSIYNEYPGTPYADDSMYEQGQLLELQNEYSLASAVYRELYRNYSTSPLAEESLFRIGELYLMQGEYKKARDAFYFHRLKFPRGKLVDVSLYSGAEAADKMGESYGSVLLLEKLLDEYPDSSFRPEALQKIAAVYADQGEYKKALAFYSEFLSGYRDSDSVSDVEDEIKKLNLLQSGMDEQEAELLVTIENEGTGTEKSRNAYIELARMYLYKFPGRADESFELLQTVLALKQEHPPDAARAAYYLGDYYYMKNDYSNAARSFVEAASLDTGNRDLTAVSMLRAAEMALDAGDMKTAEKMVRLLQVNFPSSQWLEEGLKLMEARK